MGKCKNCEHWDQEFAQEYMVFNKNYANCCCDKFLYESFPDESKKSEYDNYHLIYSDSEGLYAELRTHKEFGCINFRKKKNKESLSNKIKKLLRKEK